MTPIPEHVTTYVALLLQLHRLMSTDNDNEEADAVRDRMDEHWHLATDEERELFSDLSSALYIVQGGTGL